MSKNTARARIGFLLTVVAARLRAFAAVHRRQRRARCGSVRRRSWVVRIELRDDLSHPLLGGDFVQPLALRDPRRDTVRTGAYRSGGGWRFRGRIRDHRRYRAMPR
ncbi:hypothetical protein ACV229_33470 [Burkholderia sp. MR1-5-21]